MIFRSINPLFNLYNPRTRPREGGWLDPIFLDFQAAFSSSICVSARRLIFITEAVLGRFSWRFSSEILRIVVRLVPILEANGG